MLTAAEVLIRKAPDPKYAATASRIVTSGNRMNRMIGQLLDFTRIRVAGGLPLERAATDLVAVWRQAIEEAAEKGAGRVELNVVGDCTGHWDADRLAQVASNLLGNALRHGSPEKAITVLLDGYAGANVAMHVQNDGEIDAELLPKLFEPFQRGDRRPRGDGLGLGLFITQQIVLAHGGSIDVASNVAGGTAFTVHLPRDPARVSAAPAP
jgi:signal transduction histidine kinase